MSRSAGPFHIPSPPMLSRIIALALLTAVAVGCGSTKSRTATEQLLASDAVDSAIAQIDFRPLADQKVYFDREYIKNYKGIGFVNAEYVISSIRQQIVSSGCLLQNSRDEADFIIEGRIGALGTDSHDIIYGLPANNILSAAVSVVPGAPILPTIPEISFARKADQLAAAKLGFFAYHRETKSRVWQSGIMLARSTSKDTWILGAGPFQSGTVHDGLQFAGSEIGLSHDDSETQRELERSRYREATVFNPPAAFQQQPSLAGESKITDQKVVPASAEISSGG